MILDCDLCGICSIYCIYACIPTRYTSARAHTHTHTCVYI